MSWLNMGALGLLFLIPLVLLLYFMKLKRREVPISCSFLWKKALEEARVDSFFQKLRVNILLFLQIFIIFLISLALARPYFKSIRNLPPKMVFILDSSGSMQTMENKKSRFDLAKEKIAEYIEGAQKGTSFVLISSTTRAKLHTGFTSDKQFVLHTLKNLKAKDTSTKLEPSLQLATSLVKTERDAQVFLFSDGADPDLERVWPRYSPFVHMESIGQARRNVGIISFDVRETGRKRLFQVFVSIKNFSPLEEKLFLTVYLNDVVKEARDVSIDPAEEKSYIFPILSEKEGRLEVRIEIDDDFKLDNRVFGIISPPITRSILLVSTGNLFLERLLFLLTTYEVKRIANPEKKDLEKADLIIWDSKSMDKISGIPLASLGTIPSVFLNCTLPADFLKPGESPPIKDPGHLSWDNTHPVNAYIDYSNLNVSDVQRVKSPPWGKVLLKSDKSDLIILIEKGVHRSIVFTFDPFHSELYVSPIFPILMSNILDFFLQSKGIIGERHYRPEQSIALDAKKQENRLKVVLPGGRQKTIVINSQSPYFSETTKIGFYTFKGERNEDRFAVNLLDKNESAIAPVSVSTTKTRTGIRDLTPMIVELWQPLAFIALLALLLEWSCFHRRLQ